MPIQARTEFAAALNQVASEKGIDVKVVVEAIEQAALAAYRKDLSLRGEEIPEDFESLRAKIDPVTGEVAIMRGDQNITPPGFARIAAQTAKQVIMQKLREAEKGAITDEYAKKVGTVMSGTIQRQEGNTYFIDLGRAEGIMPYSEQTRDEYYHSGQRLKIYVKEIREGMRGPEVVVSRADPNLVKGLFAMEVPEIQTGSVVVKDIAREAGIRTKISAVSTQEGVDPVGSLVGQKGVRVQAVMNELDEEKIDIIAYSDEPVRYIASALSPAKDVQVTLEEKNGEKYAKAKLPNSQLSLAIGKGGQNARLAAKLTGWKIDIEGLEEEKPEKAPAEAVAEVVEESEKDLEKGEQPIPTDETSGVEGRAAVEEQIEKDIDQATEEEAGTTQPEPTASEAAVAASVAESDVAKSDKAEKYEQKRKEDLGSPGDEPGKDEGDILALEQPSEEQAPTVANTSETPNVSPVEPPFPGPAAKEDVEPEKTSDKHQK